MTFLVDANAFSEARRRAPDPNVLAWFASTPGSELFTSVLVFGELRRWVELARRRDVVAAQSLEAWLREIERNLADRVLPVSRDIADMWGELGIPDPVPDVDGLIAATALVHDLTIVTRNVGDFERTGVRTLNPFEDPSGQ